MTTHSRQLDLPQRSFALAVRIVRLCLYLDGRRGICRAIADQLIRSGTSIGANIEEAWGAQSLRDYLAKISIACKEARETLYWIRLLAETGLVRADRVEAIGAECSEVVAILSTVARRTKKKLQSS